MTSNAFRQPLSSALNIDGQERFDLAFLRRLLQAIDVRLQPLQEQQASAEDLLDNLQGLTLDRINNILTPAIQQVFELTSRGFLIANSATEATIAIGDVHTFIVGDETERELFTPSPFTALTRLGSTEDYGIARTVSYDQETGEYVCLVLSVYGSGGPHSDWVIGAMAGSTIAQYALFADAQELRQAIVSDGAGAIEKAREWAEKETAPDGPDTMSARTAAKLSTAAALAADRNRADARAWAEGAGEPQGVAGAKSAKVWSEQSHAWAEGAEPGGVGTKSAKDHAADAGDQAAAAATSAAQAALYDGPKVDTFAELAGVTTEMLEVGGYIRCISGGWTYQRVDDNAADPGLLDYTGAGGVKLRALPGERGYNVKAFGALGDDAADDATAIQKAIDAIPSVGGTVYFPRGTYRIGTGLALKTRLSLVGEDRNSTKIKATGAFVMASLVGSAYNLRIQKIGFDASLTATKCLYIDGEANAASAHHTITDASFSGATERNLDIRMVIYFRMRDVYVSAATDTNVYFYRVTATDLTSCMIYDAGVRDMNLVACSYSTMDNCVVYSSPPHTNDELVLADRCYSFRFDNCIFEPQGAGNVTRSLRFDDTQDGSSADNLVTRCSFIGVAGTQMNCIEIGGAGGIYKTRIERCVFIKPTGSSILLTNHNSTEIAGCVDLVTYDTPVYTDVTVTNNSGNSYHLESRPGSFERVRSRYVGHADHLNTYFDFAGNSIVCRVDNAEAFRIQPDRNLLISDTSTDPAVNNKDGGTRIGQGLIATSKANAWSLAANRKGSDGPTAQFYREGALVGNITVTATATAYNTSSDKRLKEDWQQFDGLETIRQLEVWDHAWKNTPGRSKGVLAQDAYEVAPYAVSTGDGETMWSVDYSKFVPDLIRAVQQLSAKVEALEAGA